MLVLVQQGLVVLVKMAVREIPYCVKWLVALVMMVVGVVVLVLVFTGNGGGDASVVMEGEENTSNIHQSNGFHLVEVTEGDTECGQFSWSEWALLVLGVVLLLKVSHLAHYCFFTKRIVKRRLAKLGTGLNNQPNVPAPAGAVVVAPVEMAHVVVPPLLAPVVQSH